jgi:hypothetical protein
MRSPRSNAGVDDPVIAFRVLNERMELARDAVDPAEHLAVAEDAEKLSLQTPATRALALYTRMFHVGRTGDLTALAELVRGMSDLADETGHALPRWIARTTAASLRIQRGQLEKGQALVAAAVDVGAVLGTSAILVEFGQRTQILEFTGRWDEYAAVWQEHRSMIGGFMNGFPMDAVIAQAQGDRQTAARLARDWFGELPRHPAVGRLVSVHFASRLAPVLSTAAAEQAYAQLQSCGDIWIFAGPEAMWGSTAHALGRYALCAGRTDDAISDFEIALASHERAGEVPVRAVIELELAAALAQRDAPGDRERVLPLAVSALETADAIGMPDVRAGAPALV